MATTTDVAVHCRDQEPQCHVTTRRHGQTTAQIVAESSLQEIDLNPFNLVIDLVHMDGHLRRSDGTTEALSDRLRTIQGQPLCLLLKLLRRAGVFQAPYDIGYVRPYNESQFVKDNIIQYVARLRTRLFGENGNRPHFVLTVSRPYKVAINGDVNFCLIEPWRNENTDSNKTH